MTPLSSLHMTPIRPAAAPPDKREVQLAMQGQRTLATHLATRPETQHIQIVDERNRTHRVELPTSVLRLLVEILGELADGNAVRVVPVHAELTTQEAADLLNVSRPHLVKLLESGELVFHRTGKHRRVRLADVMKFREARDIVNEGIMDESAAQTLQSGTKYR